MPTIPTNTLCAELGCQNPKSKKNRFCLDHGGRDTWNSKHNKSEKRQDAHDKYTSYQWRILRTVQLSRYPLCASCLLDGRVIPAQHVDHVFPWQQISEQAFSANIFQSLCASCHSSKTHLEQQGIYRCYHPTQHDYSINDYARVISEWSSENNSQLLKEHTEFVKP
jgi:5-methylcytosine-specific restriction protein A